jgi:hypothetical protein
VFHRQNFAMRRERPEQALPLRPITTDHDRPTLGVGIKVFLVLFRKTKEESYFL